MLNFALQIYSKIFKHPNIMNKILTGEHFAHTFIGAPAAFRGKEFLKDALGTTGCELSFGSLEPGQAVPFFHDHKQNEEVYIILAGEGRMQVGDQVFDIAAGSVVRVSTGAARNLKAGSEPLVYVCIQCRQGSLEQCTMEDGVITDTHSLL